MRPAFLGSAHSGGGLSNDGEVVILYYWDGETDLVTDLDYAVWGDKYEAVDKTGVAIDGPDADVITSTYLADTAIGSQDIVGTGGNPHAAGKTSQRQDVTEGMETQAGSNGAAGHDETSEDLHNTWGEYDPTPNTGLAMLLLTEFVVTPTAGEFIEIYNPTEMPVDLGDVYLTDATYAANGTYYYKIVTGSGAGGGSNADFHARFPGGATIDPGGVPDDCAERFRQLCCYLWCPANLRALRGGRRPGCHYRPARSAGRLDQQAGRSIER